ncbi:MarR family winged helix-turn-helix transcriptional regulator [Paenibacillus beijingensis]|uniref:MarR family winged helix-turn-helix transcriptional regulator n=1 Tax=Paenibacillus beijingensis TaxID=1126833 RepID=UPI000698AA49|nr:MarR family transcriptional regulator [Paenibacillus beijingensis]
MPDERNMTHELLRAFRQLRSLNSGMKPIEGCTQSETIMLYVIRRCTKEAPEGMKASDLSQYLRVTSPTVTQQVNVLEARGLLERAADPADRRVVRIRLTEEGLRLTGIAEQAVHENTRSLIAHLGEERAAILIELLDEVYRFHSDKGLVHGFCRNPGHSGQPDTKPTE